MNITAKAQGAGLGALSGSTVTALIFGIWPQLIGPPWESIITAAVTLILAVAGAWWPRNTVTTEQVVAAAELAELTPALAGATNKSDATAVAAAIAEPAVAAGLTAASAPAAVVPVPAAAPGGHSSTMKPVPRKGSAK